MQRDIGDITTSELQRNARDWAYFIRIEIPAPVGVMRFTDWRNNLTGDIDGATATWVAADVKVGRLSQGRNRPLDVSSLDFANLDFTFTNWAQSPGLRGVTVAVYHTRISDAGGVTGKVNLYLGTIDNHACGQRAKLALKPWRSKWGSRVTTHIPGLSPLLPAELSPKDSEIENL